MFSLLETVARKRCGYFETAIMYSRCFHFWKHLPECVMAVSKQPHRILDEIRDATLHCGIFPQYFQPQRIVAACKPNYNALWQLNSLNGRFRPLSLTYITLLRVKMLSKLVG